MNAVRFLAALLVLGCLSVSAALAECGRYQALTTIHPLDIAKLGAAFGAAVDQWDDSQFAVAREELLACAPQLPAFATIAPDYYDMYLDEALASVKARIADQAKQQALLDRLARERAAEEAARAEAERQSAEENAARLKAFEQKWADEAEATRLANEKLERELDQQRDEWLAEREREQAEEAANAPPMPAADRAIMLMSTYYVAATCAEAGISFTREDAESYRQRLSATLDEAQMAQDMRDLMWANMQSNTVREQDCRDTYAFVTAYGDGSPIAFKPAPAPF